MTERPNRSSKRSLLRLGNQPERFDPTRGALRSFLCKQTPDRERRRSSGDIEQEPWGLIRAELVKDALNTLSEGERDAINLAYFGGHTYREVAQLLDLPEGTVKSRIRQSVTKLAATFEASGMGARQ